MKINWLKRRKIVETETATLLKRYDRSKQWCVCEVQSHYGLPYRVLAIRMDGEIEIILSRHKTVRGAKKSIEKSAPRTAR